VSSLVQLEDDHSGEWFEAGQSGHGGLEGNTYERVIPARFTSGGDDIFMKSMIENYAQEGKNENGTPNANFQMTEATTRAAASEVLETHKGLKGAEKDAYLKTYFPRTWAHFDVNKEGRVEVGSMPAFMRFIASDQQMSL
jgi:hypothetical protein